MPDTIEALKAELEYRRRQVEALEYAARELAASNTRLRNENSMLLARMELREGEAAAEAGGLSGATEEGNSVQRPAARASSRDQRDRSNGAPVQAALF